MLLGKVLTGLIVGGALAAFLVGLPLFVAFRRPGMPLPVRRLLVAVPLTAALTVLLVQFLYPVGREAVCLGFLPGLACGVGGLLTLARGLGQRQTPLQEAGIVVMAGAGIQLLFMLMIVGLGHPG